MAVEPDEEEMGEGSHDAETVEKPKRQGLRLPLGTNREGPDESAEDDEPIAGDALRRAREAARSIHGSGLSAAELALEREMRSVNALHPKSAVDRMVEEAQRYADLLNPAEELRSVLNPPGLEDLRRSMDEHDAAMRSIIDPLGDATRSLMDSVEEQNRLEEQIRAYADLVNTQPIPEIREPSPTVGIDPMRHEMEQFRRLREEQDRRDELQEKQVEILHTIATRSHGTLESLAKVAGLLKATTDAVVELNNTTERNARKSGKQNGWMLLFSAVAALAAAGAFLVGVLAL